jgi:hypothetical protein
MFGAQINQRHASIGTDSDSCFLERPVTSEKTWAETRCYMTRRILTGPEVAALAARTVAAADRTGAATKGFATPADTAGEPNPVLKPDDYSSRLLKLIPAEVIAVFVTIDGVVRTGQRRVPPELYWAVFIFLIVVTFFYVLRVTRLPGLPPSRRQAALASLSFAVWVFAIGGPFAYSKASWYDPVYGAILLPLYIFTIPALFPE